MKHLSIYLLGLFISLPLPAKAQSATPMTDEYGINWWWRNSLF